MPSWTWIVAALAAAPSSALPAGVGGAPGAPPGATASPPPSEIALPLDTEARTGDLDDMLRRHEVRVLVTYSRTWFWVERGSVSGIVYREFQAFEDALNARHPTGHKSLRHRVVFVPVRRDELVPALLAGKGDVAAAALSVTPERTKVVDFTAPTFRDVSMIAVTGPASPPLAKLEDLAGRAVLVRRSSGYWERLEELNARFAARGLPRVDLRAAPEELEDEDLMEMVNAGLAGITVVDDLKARLWAKVYPAIVLHPEIAVDAHGDLAWMVRKGSPVLRAELDAFLKTHGAGTAFEQDLVHRYTGSTRWVKQATHARERSKFDALQGTFRKYAAQYDVDYLLSMAQGYQESQLDQSARSGVGAVGVMQLMPATGKELGVGDVNETEPNVHGGIKYLRLLIDRNLADPQVDRTNRILLGFAAYNAGPGRVQELRTEARRRGLDPNVWFGNVEVVAADRIGPETVTYVSNIFKYYVAYREMLEYEQARARVEPAVERR